MFLLAFIRLHSRLNSLVTAQIFASRERYFAGIPSALASASKIDSPVIAGTQQ